MSKRIKLTEEQIVAIEKYLRDGGTVRGAAREVLGKESRESTIRQYIRKGIIDLEGEEDLIEDDNISEDQLEVLCEHPDFSISNLAKRLRTAQRTNNQLRKVQRELFDGEDKKGFSLEDMGKLLSDRLNSSKLSTDLTNLIQNPSSRKTVEILWSDWQWGKVSESWNTEIAARAARYYGSELVKIIKEVSPEKIVFSALGDNFEDALKHGVQSTASTDTSNAEQMANCIEEAWFSILSPVFGLGVPVEFVGISGNHGSSEHKGMDMFKAGRYGMDYTLYRTWQNMCKVAGYDNVTFNIPEGHFATYEIYGRLTVAEHGYSCKGSSENALIALRNKRATNLQKYVHRVVVGDMHHYCNYDNGNLQVNGAAFGVAFDAIEYSGIMGFHAIPAQIVNIHEPVTGVGQNTVLETKVIQVAKGYD